jgi:hypothetical protein
MFFSKGKKHVDKPRFFGGEHLLMTALAKVMRSS